MSVFHFIWTSFRDKLRFRTRSFFIYLMWKWFQDKATSGKKGLGQGERALKIGGVKVSTRPGQKKVFANIEESDGEDTQEAATNDCQECEPAVENKPEKKRKMDETSGNGAAPQEGSKIKLKELVSQFLTEVNFTSSSIYYRIVFFLFSTFLSRLVNKSVLLQMSSYGDLVSYKSLMVFNDHLIVQELCPSFASFSAFLTSF